MEDRTCPAWAGYFLLNPLRRIFENPHKIFREFVREGMVVLEPGPGMGYFTLPLARMVGPKGKVIAVDVQPKMLAALSRRAAEAGLRDRIELRQGEPRRMGVEDLSGQVDFVPAVHMIHEVPERRSLLKEVWMVLRPGGKLLIVEPKFHTTRDAFKETVQDATRAGLLLEREFQRLAARGAVFRKPPAPDPAVL